MIERQWSKIGEKTLNKCTVIRRQGVDNNNFHKSLRYFDVRRCGEVSEQFVGKLPKCMKVIV